MPWPEIAVSLLSFCALGHGLLAERGAIHRGQACAQNAWRAKGRRRMPVGQIVPLQPLDRFSSAPCTRIAHPGWFGRGIAFGDGMAMIDKIHRLTSVLGSFPASRSSFGCGLPFIRAVLWQLW